MMTNPPTERQQAETFRECLARHDAAYLKAGSFDAQHDGAQDMERGPVCPRCGERMERDYWDHNAGPWECEACGARGGSMSRKPKRSCRTCCCGEQVMAGAWPGRLIVVCGFMVRPNARWCRNYARDRKRAGRK